MERSTVEALFARYKKDDGVVDLDDNRFLFNNNDKTRRNIWMRKNKIAIEKGELSMEDFVNNFEPFSIKTSEHSVFDNIIKNSIIFEPDGLLGIIRFEILEPTSISDNPQATFIPWRDLFIGSRDKPLVGYVVREFNIMWESINEINSLKLIKEGDYGHLEVDKVGYR